MQTLARRTTQAAEATSAAADALSSLAPFAEQARHGIEQAASATWDVATSAIDHASELLAGDALELQEETPRRAAAGALAGAAVLGLGVWAWRRRRASREVSTFDDAAQEDLGGVPSWRKTAYEVGDAFDELDLNPGLQVADDATQTEVA